MEIFCGFLLEVRGVALIGLHILSLSHFFEVLIGFICLVNGVYEIMKNDAGRHMTLISGVLF